MIDEAVTVVEDEGRAAPDALEVASLSRPRSLLSCCCACLPWSSSPCSDGETAHLLSDRRESARPFDPELRWERLSALSFLTAGSFCGIWTARLDGITQVAVKRVLTSHGSQRAADLACADLAREGAILGATEHAHVLRAYGRGTTPDGHPFVVLRRLSSTLSSLLVNLDDEGAVSVCAIWAAKRRWTVANATRRALELASALAYLHAGVEIGEFARCTPDSTGSPPDYHVMARARRPRAPDHSPPAAADHYHQVVDT